MSETQDPGGGTLESHPFGGGFGQSGKDHYSPTSTSNGNGLTDLSGDTHLTLLKGSSGLGSFSSYGDSDGLSRLSSDGYMEMRYIQLGDWGDLAGYTAEGLSARLIDSRSLNDSPDNVIQYRPWEKPDPSLASPILSNHVATTTSPSGQVMITTNGNGVPTTSNGKSPTTLTTLTNAFPTFSDAFGPNGQKLPSFQSQFNAFNEPPMQQQHQHHQPHPHHGNGNGDMHSPSPASNSTPSPGGASSLPSFHTLPANRGYIHHGHPPPALVTTTQAQPQFLDERHIQIFPGQIITATPVASSPHHQGVVTNGNGHHHFVTSNQILMNGPHPGTNGHPQHFITGNGSATQQFLELVPVSQMQLHGHYPPPPHAHGPPHAKLQPQTTDGNNPSLNLNDLHHTHHSSNLNLNLNVPPPAVPTTKYLTNDGHLETLIAVKLPPGAGLPFDPHHQHHHPHLHHHHPNMVKMDQGQTQQSSPQIVTNSSGNTNGNGIHHIATPGPKKSQKRKRNTLENSMDNSYNNSHNHNHHFNNNNSHDLNDPQVSSVSSTDSDFKRPPSMGLNGGMEHGIHNVSLDQGGMDKPVKKKRKRCGECTGCQRKDNCGDCAPCRNEKSHQICKVRRCEKLTEKKSCRKSCWDRRDEVRAVRFESHKAQLEPISMDGWVCQCSFSQYEITNWKKMKPDEGTQYKLLKS